MVGSAASTFSPAEPRRRPLRRRLPTYRDAALLTGEIPALTLCPPLTQKAGRINSANWGDVLTLAAGSRVVTPASFLSHILWAGGSRGGLHGAVVNCTAALVKGSFKAPRSGLL